MRWGCYHFVLLANGEIKNCVSRTLANNRCSGFEWDKYRSVSMTGKFIANKQAAAEVSFHGKRVNNIKQAYASLIVILHVHILVVDVVRFRRDGQQAEHRRQRSGPFEPIA
jgi:hypothetical protein